eukprot:2164103-Prymnesium_polylepis.1
MCAVATLGRRRSGLVSLVVCVACCRSIEVRHTLGWGRARDVQVYIWSSVWMRPGVRPRAVFWSALSRTVNVRDRVCPRADCRAACRPSPSPGPGPLHTALSKDDAYRAVEARAHRPDTAVI